MSTSVGYHPPGSSSHAVRTLVGHELLSMDLFRVGKVGVRCISESVRLSNLYSMSNGLGRHGGNCWYCG